MREPEIGRRTAAGWCGLILMLALVAPGMVMAEGLVTHTQVVIWDLGAFEAAMPGLEPVPERLNSPDSTCRLHLLTTAEYSRLLKRRGEDRAVSAPRVLTRPGKPQDLDYSWVDQGGDRTRRVGMVLDVAIETKATRLGFRLTDKDELGARQLVDGLRIPEGQVAVLVVRSDDGAMRRLISVQPILVER